jgi:hypothetical protein
MDRAWTQQELRRQQTATNLRTELHADGKDTNRSCSNSRQLPTCGGNSILLQRQQTATNLRRELICCLPKMARTQQQLQHSRLPTCGETYMKAGES